jgi:hypothetical protein
MPVTGRNRGRAHSLLASGGPLEAQGDWGGPGGEDLPHAKKNRACARFQMENYHESALRTSQRAREV